MKKIFISLIILILLSNCGFTPVYTKKGMSDYNIEIINTTGDRLINNLISNQLNRNEDKSSDNKIDIDINTIYKKIISSKDATGAADSYELTAKTELKVSNKNNNNTFVFSERFILDKNENLLDEKNYERTIKQSFASSIANKMIIELNSFK
tara:strand:- start:854 stop:1309 length:456 start_codon:yes stop_codon:yes gene_type:complete